MFAGPPELSAVWSDSSVEGANRFLRGLWAFCHSLTANANRQFSLDKPAAATLSPDARKLRRDIYVNLKQISDDYARLKYNTVVSGAMKIYNAIDDAHRSAAAKDATVAAVVAEGVAILLRVLYPVTPHITFGIWRGLGYEALYGDLIDAPWPDIDDAALIQDEIDLVVQVNGKLRSSIRVAANAPREEIERSALADAQVQKFTTGPIKKIHLVPGRLINIVV
jgi:leucyl-tRNA synthetase